MDDAANDVTDDVALVARLLRQMAGQTERATAERIARELREQIARRRGSTAQLPQRHAVGGIITPQ